MGKEKLNQILDAMQGITYLEWEKLKHCIDICFTRETDKQNRKIQLTGTNEVVEEYKHLFSVREESEVNNYFAGNGEIKRVKDTK